MTKRASVKSAAVAAFLIAVCLLFVSTIRYSGAYRIDNTELSGWQLVPGQPGGPALLALKPPQKLTADLFRQAVEHSGSSLVAPPEPSVPLVLTDEYSDSLQGVLTLGDIMNLARDAGVETARFEPVCVIDRTAPSDRPGHVLVAVFDSPSFEQFRVQLSPLFPEHAGAAPFVPDALRPILTIAATDNGFSRWWPMIIEPRTECSETLRAE